MRTIDIVISISIEYHLSGKTRGQVVVTRAVDVPRGWQRKCTRGTRRTGRTRAETIVPIHIAVLVRTHSVGGDELSGEETVSGQRLSFSSTRVLVLHSPAGMNRGIDIAVWWVTWRNAPLRFEIVEAEEEGADK